MWERLNDIEVENGCYYELCLENPYNKDFIHLGVKEYKNGFFDDNNYYLRPSPSHARKIKLSKPNAT